MNAQMTTNAQNPQIFNRIHVMRFYNMVNVKIFIRGFAYKTFVWIKKKRSFSVIFRPIFIIRVMNAHPFKRMKRCLFAFVGAKFRPFPSRNTFDSTYLTIIKFLSGRFVARFFPAFPRAKRNSFIFTLRNITGSFNKNFFTFLTSNLNFFRPGMFITQTRAKFISGVFKRFLTCGTGFHA